MIINYRVAITDDIATINELFINMLRSIYGISNDEKTNGMLQGDLDRYFNYANDDTIYVAESDGLVIGFLLINIHYTSTENYTYIDDFCVDENFRGHGIGTHLLELCIQYSSSLKINKIILHVEKENKAAQKLYKFNGFVVDGIDKTRIKFVKAQPC